MNIVNINVMQKVKNLKYVLFPGTHVEEIFLPYYQSAYKLWKDVWTETIYELDGHKNIFSDDFTRQDEIGALFDGSECIMLSFFKMVDLNLTAHRDDSYFKVWPKDIIDKLIVNNKPVLIGSNITASQSFRGKHFGLSTKDLLMGLLIKRLQHTPAGAMTGTMRNNRGMHECAYRHGATPLKQGLIHHGVEVDLVGFFQDKVKPCDIPGIQNLVNTLWKKHLEFLNHVDFRNVSTL
ncbi:MAG: hypothetical protein SGI74_03650 [Oligoflexia bacterium]|nr:hypothetical protein [Oligoflexia bacterium]